MELSISSSATEQASIGGPLAWAAMACAILSALILSWFLLSRPPLGGPTKLILLVGIAVLPIGAAIAGNVVGFEASKERRFCSSCHVMTPYTDDAADPASRTLASLHTRNGWFGAESCYTCHTDYRMFGTVLTKLSGLRHLFEYYTRYRWVSTTEALETIELYHPYGNTACVRCHSTALPRWLAKPDHRGALAELRAGTIGCASDGCHGPAHPFSKPKRSRNSPVAEVPR